MPSGRHPGGWAPTSVFLYSPDDCIGQPARSPLPCRTRAGPGCKGSCLLVSPSGRQAQKAGFGRLASSVSRALGSRAQSRPGQGFLHKPPTTTTQKSLNGSRCGGPLPAPFLLGSQGPGTSDQLFPSGNGLLMAGGGQVINK